MNKFVVASHEATKLLKSIEESLNEASLLGTPAVVPLVSQRSIRADRRNHGMALRDIGHLLTGEDQSQRITQGIHANLDPGRQTAIRSANRPIADAFLGAPAASRAKD